MTLTNPSRREFVVAAATAASFAAVPVASAQEKADDILCDVVVVGSGISGLSAAVEAVELGASVVLIEKMEDVGGNSKMAEGPFAVDSPLQQEAGVDLALYDAVLNEMQFSNYRADATTWIKYLKESGRNIAWLLDKGVKFVDVRACNAGLQGWHYYDGGGFAAVQTLLDAAETAGVTVMTKTPMVELIHEGTSVVGVVAQGASGRFQIRANSVILATGGTGANAEKLGERTGFDCSGATLDCNPGNTGDGIAVAEALGAKLRTACIMGDKCVRGFGLFDHISFAATRQPVLWVNSHGQRFVNEGIVMEDVPSAFNAIFIGQDACYSVFDRTTLERFAAGDCPDPITNYLPVPAELTDLLSQVEQLLESGADNAFVGDTVEDLAAAMGVNPEELSATIDEYNLVCSAGVDTDFFKKPELLIPVTEGPFYAFKMDPLVVCAIGGLCTDIENKVIGSDGSPINGLYAVGLDGCNLYEETYNMQLGGSCNGYCIYSGRNAARCALQS